MTATTAAAVTVRAAVVVLAVLTAARGRRGRRGMRTGRTITSVKRPWPAREAGREPRSAPPSVIAGHERMCVRRTTVGAGAGPVIRRGCRGRTHWIRDSTAFERLPWIRGFMALQL